MTGLECLKEELHKQGFSKQQIEQSKIIPAMLDILSQAGGQYLQLDALQKDVKRIEKEKQQAEKELHSLKYFYESLKKSLDSMIQSRYERTEEYIKKFFDALDSCETSEGRDKLRIAQMFINSVNVDTKYDNTAFIIGLSAILTKGEIAPVEELQKINPKIPKIKVGGNARWGFQAYEEKTL